MRVIFLMCPQREKKQNGKDSETSPIGRWSFVTNVHTWYEQITTVLFCTRIVCVKTSITLSVSEPCIMSLAGMVCFCCFKFQFLCTRPNSWHFCLSKWVYLRVWLFVYSLRPTVAAAINATAKLHQTPYCPQWNICISYTFFACRYSSVKSIS